MQKEKIRALNLVGRRSITFDLQAWKITNEIILKISEILKSDHVCSDSDFGGLGMLVKQLTDKACNHIHLFISSLALADLVKMYKSPDNAKKYIADESIRRLINSLMSTDMHMRR